MNSKYFVTVLLGCLIFSISPETVFAQIEKGDKEFSIAASFMARKSENQEEYTTIFNVPIRLGIFATRNIEFEPELLLSKFKGDDAGYVLSANIAYHFNSINPERNIVPYIFGGLGVSNTFIYLPNVAYSGLRGDNFTVLNLGGGIKQFLSKGVALRLEYRFQNFFENDDVIYHHLFLGVSAFLK